MGRRKAVITCLVILTLGVIPLLATAVPSRSDCQEIVLSDSPLRGAFGAYEDITPEYISRAFSTNRPQSLQNPSENEGNIDEIKGGAIILVITNQNQHAKLLASVEGADLLIQKFITYDSAGGTPAQGENLRLSTGGRLDLDARTVNQPPADADLRWKKEGTTWKLEPANGSRFKVLIAVPVIVHYMNSKDDKGESKNVQDEFLPKTLQALFAPNGLDGRMNTFWAQAGILFFLYRLEDCKYSLKDFSSTKQSEVAAGILSPEDDCQCLFRRVNGVYNFHEIHGLDLYLWLEWSERKLDGYGAPHRKDGPSPGPGAIWVDSFCKVVAGGCGRLLAHEAGHFLLGCHICATSPTERGRCGFCPDIPDCSTEHRNRLLGHGAAAGTILTPEEIQEAREKALERLRSP